MPRKTNKKMSNKPREDKLIERLNQELGIKQPNQNKKKKGKGNKK